MAVRPKSASGASRKATAAKGKNSRSEPTASRPAKAKAPAPNPAARTSETPAHTTKTPRAQERSEPVGDAAFRRPDLVQAVAERTALKRGDAKLVMELVLEEIGKALDANEELKLAPLGNLTVKRRRDVERGTVLTVRLKRPPADSNGSTVEQPLAEPDAGS